MRVEMLKYYDNHTIHVIPQSLACLLHRDFFYSGGDTFPNHSNIVPQTIYSSSYIPLIGEVNMKTESNNEMRYVIQESVSMPYQPRKRLLWDYNIEVPNVGNDGKTYHLTYYFKISEPSLAEFERELKTGYKIEPVINIQMKRGRKNVDANIRVGDFNQSPLSGMISEGAKERMNMAMGRFDSIIEKTRSNLYQYFGTNNTLGTVLEGSDNDENI